jgi:hypothetical protein
VDKRVQHRKIATEESSNDCGDDHFVDHKAPPLHVTPDLVRRFTELYMAIPMPKVNCGTNRVIHRKIKDLENKLPLRERAPSRRWIQMV